MRELIFFLIFLKKREKKSIDVIVREKAQLSRKSSVGILQRGIGCCATDATISMLAMK